MPKPPDPEPVRGEALPFIELVRRLPVSRRLHHLREEEDRLLVELGRVREEIGLMNPEGVKV